MISKTVQFNIINRVCDSYKKGEIVQPKQYYMRKHISEIYPYDKLKTLTKANFIYLVLYLCLKRNMTVQELIDYLIKTPKKKIDDIIKTKEFVERYEVTIRKDYDFIKHINEDSDMVSVAYKAYQKGMLSPLGLYYIMETNQVKGRVMNRFYRKLKVFFMFFRLNILELFNELIKRDENGTDREV